MVYRAHMESRGFEIERDLPAAWLSAIALQPVRDELEEVYARVSRAIAERGPRCWTSGKCCNFEEYGHRLYCTGLETAYAVAEGAKADAEAIAAARARGGCPFQDGKLCGIQTIKPLGCRVYFCDVKAQGWQEELTEKMLEQIRGIHTRWEIPYRYGEWRSMLERFASGGSENR